MSSSINTKNANDAIQKPNIPTPMKYKIGKVKQTASVLTDVKSGLQYIDLKKRVDEKVYGVTKFVNHYQVEKKMGQGTFGSVYRGIHLETQRQVAMKKILINVENDLFPITAQREITILKKLNHKNVVKLIEMVYDTPLDSQGDVDNIQGNEKFFYMILPYMVSDLSGILHNPRITLGMADIKNIMLQLLEGINYIHCSKYMHRDIKTANILIDHNGTVKLADFGLARIYYGSPPNLKFPGGAGAGAKYTSVVVTRWYRAPELVLGEKYYTTAVDIWGVGCVLAEFFEKKPILQGNSDIDQGHVIFKLMGTPTEENWKLSKYLPGAELTRTNYKSTLKERFSKHLSEAGLNFLSKLLALDPYKRYTAVAAMKDPFFEEEPLPAPRLTLPCEESHESDIKRYKEELHQAMSQRAPTAPQGHMIETETSARSQHNRQHNKVLPSGPAKSMHSNNLNKNVDNDGNYNRGYNQKQSRYNITKELNSLPPKPANLPSNNNAQRQQYQYQYQQRPYQNQNQQKYNQNNNTYYNNNNKTNSKYYQGNYNNYHNNQTYDRYGSNRQDIKLPAKPSGRSRFQGFTTTSSEESKDNHDNNPLLSRIGSNKEQNQIENEHNRGQHTDNYGNNKRNVYEKRKRNEYDQDFDERDRKEDMSNLY